MMRNAASVAFGLVSWRRPTIVAKSSIVWPACFNSAREYRAIWLHPFHCGRCDSGIQRRALLHEFKDVLLAEIDYRREAANMKLFRSTFADDNGFKIPAGI